jgi:hypothetical protein
VNIHAPEFRLHHSLPPLEKRWYFGGKARR